MAKQNFSARNFGAVTVFLFSLSLPQAAFADEAKPVCKDVPTEYVYMHMMVRVAQGESVGDAYKKRMEEIEAFGKTHKLARYKITSQEMSVSNGCCGSYQPEMSISVSLELDPSYSIIDNIREELKVPSLSSSRVTVQECE